jgi:hypothetical protein
MAMACCLWRRAADYEEASAAGFGSGAVRRRTPFLRMRPSSTGRVPERPAGTGPGGSSIPMMGACGSVRECSVVPTQVGVAREYEARVFAHIHRPQALWG